VFGAGVTVIPGGEFAVAGTAAVDSGAGGTPGAFCEGVIAIAEVPSRASATPLMAVLARQMATTPRAIPIFKRIMMSSGDDVRPTFIGRRQFLFTVSALQFFASLRVSGKNI
jgi:hypothetical protein